MAVNSNYIFRGQTQSNDLAAISGGVDWSHPSGAYIGGWTSNLSGGEYEFDLYGGYGFTASKIDLVVGFIDYRYPVNSTDQAELYVNGTVENWTAGLAYTISKSGTNQENDFYIYGTGEFEMKKDLNLSVTLGSYNYDDSRSDDYLHLQVALMKGDFTFAIDKNDDSSTATGANKTNDSMRLTVGYSKAFDF